MNQRRLILAIAARQYGALELRQALDEGVTDRFLRKEVERGVLDQVADRVFLNPGAPRGWHQDVMVAVLRCAPHGVACRETALGLWTGDDNRPPAPQVLVPSTKGHRFDGIEVHRSATLENRDVTVVMGIRATGLPRTLLDLAAHRDIDDLERLINRCRRTNGLPVGALVDVAERHRGRGRAGCRSLLAAVGRCHPTVPDSDFETMALQTIRRAGLRTPVHHQVIVTDDGTFELDLFWDGCRVDLELDGRQHLLESHVMADRRRDRAIQRLGITVTRWRWAEFVADPAAMIADLVALGVPRA